MSDWKTIETAPTDGSNVLILTQNSYCFIGFYDGTASEGRRWRYEKCVGFTDGEYDEKFGENKVWKPSIAEPTHWMPLPSPPIS